MSGRENNCPMSASGVVDAYFLEHRAKLIDVAAFLDRLDRAGGAGGAGGAGSDFRMRAFRDAIDILRDEQPERARRILELLSDPTTAPIAEAGMKGAAGAYPGEDGAT